MKTEMAWVGARGIDSEPYSHQGDLAHAKALKGSGIDFVVGYLGAWTAAHVANVLAAGLAFMPCTYADRFDGATTVAELQALGLPKGTTVWLDVEGPAIIEPAMHAADLIAKINAWAALVQAAGYEAGIYVGSPQPLSDVELYNLKVTRYWKAPSRIQDRDGKFYDGPSCGWCMYQLWDSQWIAGVWVDFDFIQKDFKGRLPTWVVS